MIRDDFGNRMKDYESRNQYFLQKRTPVAIRVDMRAGHTFTRGFERPFDKIFMRSMQETMKYMCENIQNAKFGYCQSDEITIILVDYETLDSDCWFNYRTDKLCSIAASMATMKFNQVFRNKIFTEYHWHQAHKKNGLKTEYSDDYINTLDQAIDKGAMFDARCFNIPKEEVTNLIYWRQLDATRNSIQMVGQANFSHKELQGKSCSNIQDMLMERKGINWNNFPTACKRGAACIKRVDVVNAGGTPFEHSYWEIDTEMPILKGENREYVDKWIYVGED